MRSLRRLFRRSRIARRPWRLRTRLALALLVVVAPIAALLVLSHLQSLREQRESQVQSLEAIGESLAATLGNFARDLESVSFASAIALSEEGMPTQSAVGSYLRNLRESYEILNGIFITDLNGEVVASEGGRPNGAIVSRSAYFQELSTGTNRVWTTVVSEGEPALTDTIHGRPILASDGSTLGYLFFSFHPSQLRTRIAQDLPEDSNVSLMDKDGSILFMTGEGPEEPDNVSSSPVFIAAQRGESALVEGGSSPVDTGSRYGSFLQVPRVEWVVGFTRPAEVIDGPFQSRLRRDIGIMAALVVGGIGLMFVMASRLSKPLSRLADSAAAIARGEQPMVSAEAADADLRRLERAMRSMERAVNERENHLLAQNRVLETLERVGETLATELDFEEAVSSLATAALQLTQAQVASLYYFDDGAGKTLRLLGLAGQKNFPFEADDPLVRRTLTGEVLDISEIGVFPGALQPPQLDSGAAVHSFLGIPIKSRFGEVHGGLFLAHERQAAFNERHRLLAAGLARRAGIIMENARLYSQARSQQEELQKANMAKSEFIGVMSHELRTPITTIYGGARLLQSRRESLDQESLDEMIVSIEEEAERLYRLVENLLTLAKTDLSENLEPDILSIGPVIEQSIRQFAHRHPNRPIHTSIPKETPLVMGEPSYLHHVVHNLVSNADKYSESGTPINIDVSPQGQNVLVRVMDRGTGVPEDEVGMIFESFYRSKTTAKQAGGKGLGLTVCKRLVEAMSGNIWASNRKGGGLEVCFTLPVASVDEDELEAEALSGTAQPG